MNGTQDNSDNFGYIDYSIFSVMLIVSLGIGFFFNLFKKETTSQEESTGGIGMAAFPVAVSLLASQTSGATMIAIPSDIYAYGSYFMLTIPMMLPTIAMICLVFLPVLYKLNLLTSYDYLEMRFGKPVKMLISYAFIANLLMLLPITIFLPSMILSEVSGLNTHLINAVVCFVCVAYTILGGMKAVIWSDVFLASIMIISCIIVLVLGISEAGGISEVWLRAIDGGRLDVSDFSTSLTKRNTFWNAIINPFFLFASYVGLDQTSVQKLVSVNSLKESKRLVYYFTILFAVTIFLCSATGIVMFSTFYGCDPVKMNDMIDNSDKLVPHFVLKTVGHIPGLTGLFISSVFSVSLSTMAASLYAMAGIIYTDIIKPCTWYQHTEKKSNFLIKLIIAVAGLYSIFMGFLVQEFQNIMSLIMLCLGISQGVTFGAFSIGMLVPWANRRGTFIACLISFLFSLWIGIGSQVSILQGTLTYPVLPTRVDQCLTEEMAVLVNNSSINSLEDNESHVFSLFKLSPNYFSALSAVLVWLIGVPISIALGGCRIMESDPKLFTPLIHRWLPNKSNEELSINNLQSNKTADNVNSKRILYEEVSQNDQDKEHNIN